MSPSWHKSAAALILAYFGISWLDHKYLLKEDLGFGMQIAKLLKFVKSKSGTNFTVTDAWYETYSKVNSRKKCLINASTGEVLTFMDVEKKSNQV